LSLFEMLARQQIAGYFLIHAKKRSVSPRGFKARIGTAS